MRQTILSVPHVRSCTCIPEFSYRYVMRTVDYTGLTPIRLSLAAIEERPVRDPQITIRLYLQLPVDPAAVQGQVQ